MQTLTIYDNEGFILNQMQGSDLREPVGVPFIWVEIPQGKMLIKMDVTGEEHTPVFEDLPKNETQLLGEQVILMQQAIDDLILAGGAL